MYIIFSLLLLFLYYLLFVIEIHRYTCFINPKILYYDKYYNELPRVKSKRPVVISMTTIPERINKLKSTLSSLLSQNVKVDSIYINIPFKTLKGKKYIIPQWLKKLKNVTIKRLDHDYGPATKLLPTLKYVNKSTIIIVVDDDVIYGSNLVNNYVKTFYKRREREALTLFGFRIKNLQLEKDFIQKFPEPFRMRKDRYVDVVSGHNSFLVTPEMYTLDVFDYSKAPKEAVWVDDIWFSGWLKYNNIKIYGIGFKNQVIPIANITTLFTPALCHSYNSNETNNNIIIKWFYDKGVFQ